MKKIERVIVSVFDKSGILEFVKAYKEKVPLLLVPTTYKLTRKQIKELGKVKYMIFANHVIRAKVRAINDTLKKLQLTGDIREVENDIAPLSELFELIDMKKLKDNEAKYL